MRACWSSSTWCSAGCAPRLRGHLRAQHHRHRRQDHQPRAENGETIRAAHRALHRGHARGRDGARRASRPTHEPRATEYVPQMLDDDRARSSAKGLAYRRERRRRQLRGAQVSRATASCRASRSTTCAPASASKWITAKRDPLDFVLWKAAKPGEPRASGPPTMGPGPPGLAHRVLGDVRAHLLGEHFDIHGGGMDLKFPAPRERDRAERRRARRHGRSPTIWMHNGFAAASTTRRCRSRSATSSPSATCCKHYDAEVAALLHPARALPQPVQLRRRQSRRCAAGAARGSTPRWTRSRADDRGASTGDEAAARSAFARR